MTAPEQAGGSGRDERAEPQAAEPEWRRRQRLARIFGDVLPEGTSDEREPGEGRERDGAATDTWLKSQVPPHHGE